MNRRLPGTLTPRLGLLGTVVSVAVLATFPATRAAAQSQPSPWEVGVSVGAGPQITGTYEHRFTPSLSGHSEATGFAGQDVRLRGGTGITLTASVTRSLSRRLALQFVLAAARAPLAGPSSDYVWTLDYTSRQPPDYTPRPVEVTGSVAWPTTDGEMRRLAAAANLVVRYPLYERVSLAFSGGVSVQRLEGELSPLGVTLFREGGHSTLSAETYSVEVALRPAYVAGLDLGTEFAWQLSARTSLAFELRYFAAPSTRLDAVMNRVVDNGGAVHPTTPSELNAVAPPHRVEFDPSFGAALLGIRYRI